MYQNSIEAMLIKACVLYHIINYVLYYIINCVLFHIINFFLQELPLILLLRTLHF